MFIITLCKMNVFAISLELQESTLVFEKNSENKDM